MRFLTAGNSHGEALNAIISGYPSGIEVDMDFIDSELARRQAGFGRGGRMSIEKDKIKLLSGISRGKTTGSPISLIIKNLDWENWKDKPLTEENIFNPRPGHADLPGFLKYRLESIRDVIERSSARETAARVAVGAFAKLFLKAFKIFTFGYVEQIGNIKINSQDYRQKVNRSFNPSTNKHDSGFLSKIESSCLRCPDEDAASKMEKLIKKAMKEGDTLGGSVRIFTTGLVPGLGSFAQWDSRLDSRIASAVMSIPSVKAVGLGLGFDSGYIQGKDFHDEIFYKKDNGFYRNRNNAGGIEGGMSNGENIEVHAVIKPIPTTKAGLRTVDIKTKKPSTSHKERADVCAVPVISVIGESVIAIEIVNAMQEKFGGDHIEEILENYSGYRKYLKSI